MDETLIYNLGKGTEINTMKGLISRLSAGKTSGSVSSVEKVFLSHNIRVVMKSVMHSFVHKVLRPCGYSRPI